MKKFLSLITLLALLASPALADDYNLRGLDPSGNWKSLAVDANGAVKVTGAGDVVGPSSATDNAAVRFDGTTGKLVQNSAFIIADTTGDATGGKYNKITITPPASGATLTLIDGKVFTVNKTLTLEGTDGTTMTFPTTSATLARTDAANTFTGASTASAWVMTSPTITTKISPTSDDGAPLGDTTHNFADLFLASGAVVNYANSNVVLTHTSGVLTLGTGDLQITTAGSNAASAVTVGGTQTLTNKTLTSPTLTTPSAFTTGGVITLAENSAVALDPAGSADGKYTGTTITAVAGYAQTYGDLVYLDPTDSRWELADANSAAAADGDSRGTLGVVVVAGGSDGAACTILLQGVVRADAKFATFTVNNPIYVSETAGAITQTQPSTTDVVIRVAAVAITTDEIYFSPSPDYTTHT